MKKIMTIAALAAMLVSCGGGGKQGKPDFSDNEYAVRTLGSSDADLQTKYPANVKGMQDVEIRPKVSGFITRINVKEGQQVAAGQVLFEIDNVTYKSQVNQAQAALNSAKSQMNTAKLTYDNAQKLFAANVIGQYELDSSKNTYETAVAGVAQAEAALASAKEALSYCFVAAPTSGVVGSLPYKVGALVSASSIEPLTTVSNNSGLEIYFSVTEKELLKMAQESGSVQAAINQMPSVKLQLADGSLYTHEGKVVKASGVIDQATGSVSLIAHFPNPQGLLKAGASGYVVYPHKAVDKVIIPQSCVADVLNKHFVYVVGKDNKVKYTEITVDPNDDGQNYIVVDGLKKGDRIVVDGITSLKDGMEIKPITEQQLKQKMQKLEKLAQVQGDGVLALGEVLSK